MKARHPVPLQLHGTSPIAIWRVCHAENAPDAAPVLDFGSDAIASAVLPERCISSSFIVGNHAPMKLTAIALLPFCLHLLLAASPAHAQSDLTPVPEMKGYVADVAGVLTQEERDRFTGLIRDVAKRTGSQLGVVVVDHTDPEPIEEFAQRVFTTWKLGRKGIDDGVLLVLAINNKGRRLRIQVGYGLEGTITDAVAKRVLAEEIRPSLEQSGPGGAINSGVNALTSLMQTANIKEPKAAIEARQAAMERLQWGTLVQVGLLILTALLMTRRIRLSTRLAAIAMLSLAASALYIWVAGNVWWAFAGAVWLGIALVMAWKNWRKATQAPSLASPASVQASLPPIAVAPAKSSRRGANRKGKSWRHVSPVAGPGKDAGTYVAEDHLPVKVGLPLTVTMHFVAAAIAATIGAANGSTTMISVFAGVGWWIMATILFTLLTGRHGWQDPSRQSSDDDRGYGGDSSSGGWSGDSGGFAEGRDRG